MENTETLIVEQLKAGNENAYRYLYDHHYALLCHVANGYLKDQFLSETIVGILSSIYGKYVKRWISQFLSAVTC